jgi:2-keto-4-pentenoate hydratase/2-oxohepta-3-ene-1,7-dioic acid hydratase in catechol pathway
LTDLNDDFDIENAGYLHLDMDGHLIDLPVGKVVCVGRNYADHAREMGSAVSGLPMLFIKPSTSICYVQEPIHIPKGRGEVHHEVEVAFLIGERLTRATPEQALAALAGVGLGLDLTLRNRQAELKQSGQPWEEAKAFDGSCPLSPWLPLEAVRSLDHIPFQLFVNGEIAQQGNTRDMLVDVTHLVAYMSYHFTLLPGDVVLTGTPAGVGPMKDGDMVRLTLSTARWETLVVDN